MIHELEKMCQQRDFDITVAEDIISKINVNQVFPSSEYCLDTTLLSCAAEGANYKMVELLLKHGADPNLIYDNETENVLWDLQYSEDNTDENETRLRIVKLLLDYGANPLLKLEGEELYHWVTACWQDDMGVQADYRSKYIDLLEKYL